MIICWKFFFVPLDSLFLTKNEDSSNFFHLISERIPVQRMENAKLLYRATRDSEKATPFPYEIFTDKGPYLFVI